MTYLAELLVELALLESALELTLKHRVSSEGDRRATGRQWQN
jgi:hypothetical protein